MKHIKLLSMDLQRFADDVDNPDVDETSKDEKIKDDEKQEKTFTRADVGKMMAAEISKQKAEWEKEYEAKLNKAKNEGISEGEKMAKMTADEKANLEAEKREADLAKREAEITKRELKSVSQTQLLDANLPVELVDLLDLTDADKCQESFNKLKEIWEKAQGSYDERIKKDVNERLVQKQTKVGTGAAGMTKAQIMEIKDPVERQKAIAENRNLF